MNLGILLAVLSGFLWSVSNILDKTIVTKYFPNPKLIFLPISTAYFVIGGIVLIVKGAGLPLASLGLAICASLAYLFMSILYFYAARREEISRIVPLFAFSTVFVVVFGAIFLNEIFPFRTYSGIVMIIIGAVLIMLKSSLSGLFRSRAFGLMLVANIMVAVHSIIIKHLTGLHAYWSVFGWITFIDGLLGLIIFAPQWPILRQEIAKRGWRGVRLVLLSDGNGALASFCFTIAASYWFISLVNAVSLVQFIFVFVWSLIISRFKPALFSENITWRIAFQKILAIAMIIAGIFLIT